MLNMIRLIRTLATVPTGSEIKSLLLWVRCMSRLQSSVRTNKKKTIFAKTLFGSGTHVLARVATIRYVNGFSIVRRDPLTMRLSNFLVEVASYEFPLYGVCSRQELQLQLKEISFRTHRPRTRSSF